MKADCANCLAKACYFDAVNCTGVSHEEILQSYTDEEKRIMKAAADVEGTFYSSINRLQETVEFAKRMGYKKLGMAFCVGLAQEAELIAKYFKNQGFEFYSVCCKTCGVDKTELGLPRSNQRDHETVCNPKTQARFLNEKEVDLYLTCGLCVGHDSIFIANVKGPVTGLVAKDKMLCHVPLEAVYSGYWRHKLGIKGKPKTRS